MTTTGIYSDLVGKDGAELKVDNRGLLVTGQELEQGPSLAKRIASAVTSPIANHPRIAAAVALTAVAGVTGAAYKGVITLPSVSLSGVISSIKGLFASVSTSISNAIYGAPTGLFGLSTRIGL